MSDDGRAAEPLRRPAAQRFGRAELSGSGPLYTASRREAEDYAAEPAARGVRAFVCHGGMKAADRDHVHPVQPSALGRTAVPVPRSRGRSHKAARRRRRRTGTWGKSREPRPVEVR